jgi:radical SAM protein with 4Fe4S-binding SPASM domain
VLLLANFFKQHFVRDYRAATFMYTTTDTICCRSTMISNPYRKTKIETIKNNIKFFLEDNYPTIFEKYVLQNYIRMVDLRRRPTISSIIKEKLSQSPFPLFDAIEIETINQCNNTCPFCPVNKKIDPRPLKVMDYDLFTSIIKQLRDLDYSGVIRLFSNNEPLLDSRIIDFCRLTKENVPNAFLSLFTNGTLLTIEKFTELTKYLDKLTIDNYHDDFILIKPVKEVYDYCVKNKINNDNVEIFLRKKNAIEMTRAGEAKNRTTIKPLRSSCILPFSQMVIRPDGKASLCCNDALGKVTLGDLTQSSIIDVWNSSSYWEVRKKILSGRKNLPPCDKCDYMSLSENRA